MPTDPTPTLADRLRRLQTSDYRESVGNCTGRSFEMVDCDYGDCACRDRAIAAVADEVSAMQADLAEAVSDRATLIRTIGAMLDTDDFDLDRRSVEEIETMEHRRRDAIEAARIIMRRLVAHRKETP